MQQISNLPNSRAYYAYPDGTTVGGYVSNTGRISGSFCWTARGGASDVPGDVRGALAWGGDLLVARVWDGTKIDARVPKYDTALSNGGALPIDIIEAGLVPEGYEASSLEVTDNARLLAGTARDAEGKGHGWLLRLRHLRPVSSTGTTRAKHRAACQPDRCRWGGNGAGSRWHA